MTRPIRTLPAVLACLALFACPPPEPTAAERLALALQRGDEALAAGDLAAAELAFSEAISLAPDEAGPHLALGVVRMRQGRDAQAVLELKRAVELSPNDPAAHARLGEAYARSERIDLAVGAFQSAIRLGDGQARLPLARALLAARRIAEADEAAAAILVDDPGNGAALALRAEVKLLQQDEMGAAKLFDEAVQRSADDHHVRLARARFFLGRGKLEEARVEAAAALARAPASKPAAETLVRALLGLGRLEEASQAIAKARESRAEDPALAALSAEVKLASGDGLGARKDADWVLERFPRHGPALLVRARAIARSGEQSATLKAYEAAAEVGEPAALAELAALYRQRSEPGQALSTLERLLAIEPDRYEDALALCELRAELGRDRKAGLELARRLKARKPDDLRVIAVEAKLIEGARSGPSSEGERPRPRPRGPEVIRGGR